MARSDLLISLVKATSQGDPVTYRRTLEVIIAEERAKQHHILADRSAQYLGAEQPTKRQVHTMNHDQPSDLLYEVTPKRLIEDLIMPDVVVNASRELIEEQHRRDLLRAHNIEPRHRVLLIGPPGNGKTSLAEALATELMVPMFVIRYEGVVGSYLGETANRVRALFDYVRTRQCLLFLDEFDTLGKERGDTHETGEIKRVVSTLLLQLDSLPTHVVVITATNHPELLDRAVWRRFQLRLTLPLPTQNDLERWFNGFAARLDAPLGYSVQTLAKLFVGNSYAEVEDFCTDILRRSVLESPGTDIKLILRRKLEQWKTRAKQIDIEDN